MNISISHKFHSIKNYQTRVGKWLGATIKEKRKGQIIDVNMGYKYPKKLDEKENPYRTIGFHS